MNSCFVLCFCFFIHFYTNHTTPVVLFIYVFISLFIHIACLQKFLGSVVLAPTLDIESPFETVLFMFFFAVQLKHTTLVIYFLLAFVFYFFQSLCIICFLYNLVNN